jgi:hypothetical protein
MDAVMIFMLPVALAVGLWLLARGHDRRDAGQAAAIRRTYKDTSSSPWSRPKSRERSNEHPSAGDDDEVAAALELSSSGVFQVPKKP